MKKNKTYYSENNQENEDVYTLYPDNAIISEDVKKTEPISNNIDAVNSVPSTTKMQLRHLIHSHSMMFSRVIETHTAQPPLL